VNVAGQPEEYRNKTAAKCGGTADDLLLYSAAPRSESDRRQLGFRRADRAATVAVFRRARGTSRSPAIRFRRAIRDGSFEIEYANRIQQPISAGGIRSLPPPCNTARGLDPLRSALAPLFQKRNSEKDTPEAIATLPAHSSGGHCHIGLKPIHVFPGSRIIVGRRKMRPGICTFAMARYGMVPALTTSGLFGSCRSFCELVCELVDRCSMCRRGGDAVAAGRWSS
jgi:hypothetical protein